MLKGFSFFACKIVEFVLIKALIIKNEKRHNVKYEMINNFFQRLNIWTMIYYAQISYLQK